MIKDTYIKVQVYDVETRTDWKTLRLVGLYDGSSYRHYKTIEEAVKDMAASGGIWYAHNGGRFDFRFFYEYLVEHYKLKTIYRNGSFFKVSVYKRE